MIRNSDWEENYFQGILSKSPFDWEILQYFLPLGFEIPSFGIYDCSTDPDEHLQQFTETMDLYLLPEPAWCQLFSITLMGNAGRWFDTLPPRSISAFSQLENSFQANFIFQRKIPRYIHEILVMEEGLSEEFKKPTKLFSNMLQKTFLKFMLFSSTINQEFSQYYPPQEFVIPSFEFYNGSTDPDEHLRIFTRTMNLFDLPDMAWCKIFSITLLGNADQWIRDLPPYSISTFSQLSKRFLTNFSYLRKLPRYLYEIFSIQQGPDEPLKEYVQRFSDRILDIGERSDGLMIDAFINGLRPGVFLKYLTAKLPSTLDDLVIRAYNFQCAQEATTKRMNSEYQRGEQSNRALRWMPKTFAQSDGGFSSWPYSLDERTCTLEFDGAAKGNPGPAGAGVVLRDVDRNLVYFLREGLGIATNNVAEYKALILGLQCALDKGFSHIRVQGDSKLVCMQVNDIWRVNGFNMFDLWNMVKDLKYKFVSFEIGHVDREYNSEADAQANLGVYLQIGEIEEEVFEDRSAFKHPLEWQLENLNLLDR